MVRGEKGRELHFMAWLRALARMYLVEGEITLGADAAYVSGQIIAAVTAQAILAMVASAPG